jgi:hypothetical protein
MTRSIKVVATYADVYWGTWATKFILKPIVYKPNRDKVIVRNIDLNNKNSKDQDINSSTAS